MIGCIAPRITAHCQGLFSRPSRPKLYARRLTMRLQCRQRPSGMSARWPQCGQRSGSTINGAATMAAAPTSRPPSIALRLIRLGMGLLVADQAAELVFDLADGVHGRASPDMDARRLNVCRKGDIRPVRGILGNFCQVAVQVQHEVPFHAPDPTVATALLSIARNFVTQVC